MMTDAIETKPRRRIPGRAVLAAVALFGAGGAVGATAARMAGPTIEVAPLSPVAISSLRSHDGLVTVRGKVGETYGTMFTLADGSGRTLVDGGPRISGLVATGAPVTIQGWSRDGVVRASFLVGADGKVTPLGPMGHGRGRHGPGHDGPGGPGGPGGPDREGPDRDDRDGPPPPAAGGAPVAPVPAGNSAG